MTQLVEAVKAQRQAYNCGDPYKRYEINPCKPNEISYSAFFLL